MEKDELTTGQLESFLRKTGKRGADAISILGKNAQFINSISTVLGQELLKDITIVVGECLAKIYYETATEEDRADFRSAKRILERWMGIINKQKELTDTVNEINRIKTK